MGRPRISKALGRPDNPAKGNNFLIAKDGDKDLIVEDFELRFSYRFVSEWGDGPLPRKELPAGEPEGVIEGELDEDNDEEEQDRDTQAQ